VGLALCTVGALVVSTNSASSAAPVGAPSRMAPTTAAQSRDLPAPPAPPSDRPSQRDGYRSPTARLGPARAAANLTTTPSQARTWGTPGSATTLVVYDTTGAFGWLGELYAIGAGNLASHFGTVTAEPVVDYQAGQLSGYSATIYLGSTYNEPIPVTFLNDVLATTRPVIWAGDNIWQLSGTGTADQAFQSAYGWDPSTSYFDNADQVTQVLYNGQTLSRSPSNDSVLAPHITSTTGQVTVVGQAQCGSTSGPVACAGIAQVPAGATTFPWAIASAHLTYLGEIPLSYLTESDRYLAFSDLMFTTLSPSAPSLHQALVRLEDVSPGTDKPAKLMAAADYLSSVHVPFSVAVIPAYTDPNGFYNGGVPVNLNISQVSNPTVKAFNAALRYMVSKGGTLIEHGYTHQYSNIANPYSAVTADDFEFFRAQCATTQNPPYTFNSPCPNSDWVIQEGPVANDSTGWAQSRAATGQPLFAKAGFATPTIWETPHYSASAADYRGIDQVYGTRYERELFYGGQLSGRTADNGHIFGQFFPYVVHDLYGTTIVPENLGNYEPTARNHNPPKPPSYIIDNARAELVVRQGVASFFFHPFFKLTFLQQIVAGIQSLGYDFVSPAALLPK
jgi:uncharacterized protein YdaL